MLGTILALCGAGFVALAGYGLDSWAESQHASDMVTAFVDVAVGSFLIGMAVKYD
jgi:fluoride ion exporter CrcB/FEX